MKTWKIIRCHHAGTIIHVAVNGKYYGHIVIEDELKPTSVKAIKDLIAAGVRRIVMLTGDTEEMAQDVAEETGIREYKAGLMPSDKVAEVEKLLGECGEKTKSSRSSATA